MYNLKATWDKEYSFDFKEEYQFRIAKSLYSYMTNPQVVINVEVVCFETYFLERVSNLISIRDKAHEEAKKVKLKPKRKFISVKDIWQTDHPVDMQGGEFSEYYIGIWGLDK